MAFIPDDAEWYLAELVEEIDVEDDPRNLVWRNLTLVRADSPAEAYEKALRFGHEGETEYLNPQGKEVRIRFRGISQLNVIYDELEDGAELSFFFAAESFSGADRCDVARKTRSQRLPRHQEA